MFSCNIMRLVARIPILFLLIASFVLPAFAQGKGVKKRRPLPDESGNVVMNNLSQKNGLAPVVFSHWVHRAKFTCRLCHVDIAFAMEANGTQMREEDNRKGYYCGACHNGKIAFPAILRKPSGEEARNCDRCHPAGKDVPQQFEFSAFTADLPKGRFGDPPEL